VDGRLSVARLPVRSTPHEEIQANVIAERLLGIATRVAAQQTVLVR
jgi:hypothetical protein